MKPFTAIELPPGAPVPVFSEYTELRPIGVFLLPEGAIDNKLSYCCRLVGADGHTYVAQITHAMLMEAIESRLKVGS